MRVTIRREAFLKPFAAAEKIVPGKTHNECFRYILLTADSEGTTLTASDGYKTIHVSVPEVEVHAPGAALLPTELFAAVLHSGSHEHMDIRSDEVGALEVSAEFGGTTSRWKLITIAADDFPRLAEAPPSEFHSAPATLLGRALDRVEYAAKSSSESKATWTLDGVLVETKGEHLSVVASDGSRLACVILSATEHGEHGHNNRNRIVPNAAIRSLSTLLSELDGSANVSLTANSIWVVTDSFTFTARLLEGAFPQYDQLLASASNGVMVEMPIKPLLQSVRQASIACDRLESLGADFTLDDGTLLVTAESADKGKARVEMPIFFEKAKLSLYLSTRYILDMLKALPPDGKIELRATEDGAAVRWTAEDLEYVVMPISRPAAEEKPKKKTKKEEPAAAAAG